MPLPISHEMNLVMRRKGLGKISKGCNFSKILLKLYRTESEVFKMDTFKGLIKKILTQHGVDPEHTLIAAQNPHTFITYDPNT